MSTNHEQMSQEAVHSPFPVGWEHGLAKTPHARSLQSQAQAKFGASVAPRVLPAGPQGFWGRCGCTEGAWAQGTWCSYRTGDAQGHAQHHPMVTAAPSNGLCLSAFHPKRLPEEWGNPSPGHSPKWVVWTEWDAARGETQPMGPIFAAKPAGSSPLGKHTLQSPPAP